MLVRQQAFWVRETIHPGHVVALILQVGHMQPQQVPLRLRATPETRLPLLLKSQILIFIFKSKTML